MVFKMIKAPTFKAKIINKRLLKRKNLHVQRIMTVPHQLAACASRCLRFLTADCHLTKNYGKGRTAAFMRERFEKYRFMLGIAYETNGGERSFPSLRP